MAAFCISIRVGLAVWEKGSLGLESGVGLDLRACLDHNRNDNIRTAYQLKDPFSQIAKFPLKFCLGDKDKKRGKINGFTLKSLVNFFTVSVVYYWQLETEKTQTNMKEKKGIFRLCIYLTKRARRHTK